MDTVQFENRKRDHLRHSLNPDHQASGLSGLDTIRLVHEALPELDLEEVRLQESCLSQTLATPFFVAGMTMGHPDASAINLMIARACAQRGWAMGVGSQRRELDQPAASQEARLLRQAAPQAFLISNLGLSQVIRTPLSEILRVTEALGAQALVIHLNALQEALQPEGTPQFRGGLSALTRLARELPIPLLVKETGCGFSVRTLRALAETGVAAVDVSGLGGTHWGRIEGARAPDASLQAQAARTFANWGRSTADSVLAAREALQAFQRNAYEVWASGGVRSGLDAAKLIALGANRVGYAQPALQAAMAGEKTLHRWMEQQEFELRVALFCTGKRSPAELRQSSGAWEKEILT